MADNGMKERVLEYVSRYRDENGYAPTYREVGRAVGLTSTSSVSHYIKSLEREGRLEVRSQHPRALTLRRDVCLEGPEDVRRICLETADGGELCFDCAMVANGNGVDLSFSGILDATGLKNRVGRVVRCFVEEAD